MPWTSVFLYSPVVKKITDTRHYILNNNKSIESGLIIIFVSTTVYVCVCISGSNNNKPSLLRPRVLTLDLRCYMYTYVYVKSTHAAMGKQFFANDKNVLADLLTYLFGYLLK